ncbi:MAG: dipeptidase PepE [Alistipes sp.]|mgnify:FL=1|nr:dipeptidase PepE [Alistipes sp.]MBR3589846.1 dipeptidase PepE [Alistipes sp.]MBR3892591.1 dipeptidase PepE [Alistipes sp.]MBR6631938.1 dipeptidase PepE [Alistipes sp.]
MNLLLISNSTNAGEAYLKYPIAEIEKTLAGVTEVVFIPYAAVTFSYEEYERKVQERFDEIGIKVRSVHRALNKRNFVRHAQAIVIGGGNTFALLKKMQEEDLLDVIFRRVRAGVPYVGWSAGSNVTCPTICTTNDMPIVEPQSFRAIGLVPFQINPHYLDANPAGHAGETREQRILEYLEANRSRYVVGLREGCMIRIKDENIELIGSRTMRIFKKGIETYEVQPGDDISFLIKR